MEDCGVGKLDHNLERNRRVKEVTHALSLQSKLIIKIHLAQEIFKG